MIFFFLSADIITDNYLTIMADTHKITNNRNQHFNAFFFTHTWVQKRLRCSKQRLFAWCSIAWRPFSLVLCSCKSEDMCDSCLHCVALHRFSSLMLWVRHHPVCCSSFVCIGCSQSNFKGAYHHLLCVDGALIKSTKSIWRHAIG